MAKPVSIRIEVPGDLARLKLPRALDARLRSLLDQQDQGTPLTRAQQKEAEGIVDLADVISFLRLKIERAKKRRPDDS